SGQFGATFTSASTGKVLGNASTTVTVAGVQITRATGDGLSGDSGAATKVFEDITVAITPDAHNWVNQNHTFTATVYRDSGDGSGFHPQANAPVSITFTPSLNSTPSPAGPFSGTTDANGHFSATFTSATTGQVAGNATTTQTLNSVQITRTTGDSYASGG